MPSDAPPASAAATGPTTSAAVRDAAPGSTRAARTVGAVFIANGFAMASWTARIPQLRDSLGLTPAQLGLVLLSVAGGSLTSIPSAGRIVGRLGEARTVAGGAATVAAGLVAVALGYRVGVAPVVVGFYLLGLGNGVWDVAMNVQGAAVEQKLGRSVMSRFHAGFSVGTVAGAGIAAALVAASVGVTVHLLVVGLVVVALVPLVALRGFMPHGRDQAPAPDQARPRSAWRERRTVLIGVFVLCMAFTEGTGNDWLSVGVIDGYHTTAAEGTTAFAVFLAAMTAGRWFGPGVLDRHGRVRVLRLCTVVALAGLLLVCFGRHYPSALIGAALWGLGASLGFPTGMSAAADDPPRAPARVSVAASIAYVAFLAGPPVVGFVGNHAGVLRGLLVTAGLLALAAGLSGACAPLPGTAAAAAPSGSGDAGSPAEADEPVRQPPRP